MQNRRFPQRKRKRTDFYRPADEEDRFIVKTSNISNAGNGLFTKYDIKRGEKLLKYKGEELTKQELEERYPGDTLAPYVYIFYHDDDKQQFKVAIDGDPHRESSKHLTGKASYINDARDEAKNNVTMGEDRWIRALRDIPKGSELYLWYGEDYWKDNKDMPMPDDNKGAPPPDDNDDGPPPLESPGVDADFPIDLVDADDDDDDDDVPLLPVVDVHWGNTDRFKNHIERLLPRHFHRRVVQGHFGVFTTADFKQGSVFGQYTGHLRKVDSKEQVFRAHAVYVDRSTIVDGNPYTFPHKTNIFSYLRAQKRNAYNCRFVNVSGLPKTEVFIQTTKRVKKGDELLVDHGELYWKKPVNAAIILA